MKSGGIEAVVRAGLSICDEQDWRRCEAVAEVIAQAKTGDVSLLFTKLGPQVCAINHGIFVLHLIILP